MASARSVVSADEDKDFEVVQQFLQRTGSSSLTLDDVYRWVTYNLCERFSLEIFQLGLTSTNGVLKLGSYGSSTSNKSFINNRWMPFTIALVHLK